MDVPESQSGFAIEWVRKRDGDIARFEPEKLALSLRHANDDLTRPHSESTVAELAKMAVFFVQSHLSGDVVATEEIAECLEKSLGETGHEELAVGYARYRERKFSAEQTLRVHPDPCAETESTPQESYWSKSRLIASLRARLNLDVRRAREIASQVERIVMRSRMERLSAGLIRALANDELARWELRERLLPLGQVQVGVSELRRHLFQPIGSSLASWLVARRVWRDYSLHEIVSRDVSDVVCRGVLDVHCLSAPSCLAASCVDCGGLIRQAHRARDSIADFGTRFVQALDVSSTLIAIDRLESWLALVAEPADTPSTLAELWWNELHPRLRLSPVQCVLNLYGNIPASLGFTWGAGPLFNQQPLSAEREFAGAVALEILGLFQRDAGDLPNLRIDWHWSTSHDPVQMAILNRVMRMISEGLALAIVFEREPLPLGEGVRRSADVVRPVLDFIGLNLPLVWRDAGSPRSLPALSEGLIQTVHQAVRAAVQRREYMRRLPVRFDSQLTDSATLALYPIGLDWTVQQLMGRGLAEDEGALKLAETLVRNLSQAAEREARHFALSIVIDHPQPNPLRDDPAEGPEDPTRIPGLVPTSGHYKWRRQIYAGGRLHGIVQAGTLPVRVSATSTQNDGELEETLDWACRNTDAVRLLLVPGRSKESQSVVAWPQA